MVVLSEKRAAITAPGTALRVRYASSTRCNVARRCARLPLTTLCAGWYGAGVDEGAGVPAGDGPAGLAQAVIARLRKARRVRERG